jgi:hypothetical protein
LQHRTTEEQKEKKIMIDQTEGALQKAKEHAKEIGMEESLQFCLDRVEQIAANRNGWLYLFNDFAPHSLYFQVVDKPEPPYEMKNVLFNGGIIFHAPNVENHSVTLEPHHGWKIHT